jgi:glycerophosphoryl diester phosphodiesterase
MIKPIIIAHRGVSHSLPENTMPAFERAIDFSCEGIEFDVQLTKDGIPVIIHDETIERTSNGKGFVKDHTLKTLRTFNFGVNFSLENIQIPTLEEFLQMLVLKKYNGLINIELKNDKVPYKNLEKLVLELIESYGLFKKVVISSFNHESMKKIRSLSSSVNLSLLYLENQFIDISDLQSIHAFSANIHIKDANFSLINSLHRHNIQCFCYTANTAPDIKNLLQHQIDGFFTDNPLFAKQIRDQERS